MIIRIVFVLDNVVLAVMVTFFFFQAEDGIRDLVRSRGLGDVYKRQPNNCENWYVLVNAPSYGLDNNDLDSQKKYVELIFERLKTFDVNPEVISYKIIPPSYIEQTYNSLGGAIYGSSSNSIFSAFLRPRSKVPKIKNMFFCGGSSHPVSYTHLRAHETVLDLVCRLLLEK